MARPPNGIQLYKRTGSPVWYADFTINGKRHRPSTGEADYARATEVAQRLFILELAKLEQQKQAEREASAPSPAYRSPLRRYAAEPAAVTVEKAINALLSNRESTERSPGTLTAYRSKAKPVLLHLGSLALDSLSPAAIHEYVRSRRTVPSRRNKPVSLYTVSQELAVLEMALNHAASCGWYEGKGSAVIPSEYRNAYKPRQKWFTIPQLQAFLEYFRNRAELAASRNKPNPFQDYDYLVGWSYSGARARELFRIQVQHVDVAGGMLFLPGTKTAKSRRWVPIAPPLMEVLKRRISGLSPDAPIFPPMTNSVWHVKIKRACRRLSLPEVSILDLRHTYATALITNNVSSRIVAELLGHSSTRLVDATYAHLNIRSVAHIVVNALPDATPTRDAAE